MGWTGYITLIAQSYEQDARGVRHPVEKKTKVRADVSGTTSSEFFEAGRAGLKVSDSVFTIPVRKYNGESILEYKGERLSIYRTYPPAADLLEIHCEQKAGVNGND